MRFRKPTGWQLWKMLTPEQRERGTTSPPPVTGPLSTFEQNLRAARRQIRIAIPGLTGAAKTKAVQVKCFLDSDILADHGRARDEAMERLNSILRLRIRENIRAALEKVLKIIEAWPAKSP